MFFIVLSCFFFSSRRRHTRFDCDWSSDVCSSDLPVYEPSFASACWISVTRSRVGACWPRSFRLDLEDCLLCELLCAVEPAAFLPAGLACTEGENAPSPAASSSDEARCVAF